jgi:VCBS repeat protein
MRKCWINRLALSLGVLAFATTARGATFIVFSSQPGDYIGQGQYAVWTPADANFSTSTNVFGQPMVEVKMDGGGFLWWTLWFAAPQSAVLQPGVYENAQRYPFQSPTAPGLDVFGSGRGCNQLSGRFVVREITRDGAGSVTAFAADFEQHCEMGSAALFGAVRYNSNVPYEPRAMVATGANAIARLRRTGDLWAVRVEGSRITDGVRLTLQLPDGWKAVGTGDFDGDREPDLVFQRNSDGAIAVWLMSWRQVKDAILLPYRVADQSWKIVAVGDINGDGSADLVWQHQTDGWLGVWYMNGTAMMSGELLQPGQVADTNWQIVAATDMDGDGSVDLLWRHMTQGWVAVWRMRGPQMLSGELIHPVPVPIVWRLKGAADVNADGQTDLLWEGTEGEVYPADNPRRVIAVWRMKDLRIADGTLLTPPSIDTYWDPWDLILVR